MSVHSIWCGILMVFVVGCHGPGSAGPPAHEDLDAALWMRTAAEYHVLATDTFRRAAQSVSEALKDPAWSALPSQSEALAAAIGEPLPPAVILDIDETILDTSAYQVRQILQQGQYQKESWNQWVAESAAVLVPGAREFVRACQDAGITVFYVTNRDVEVERYTRRNLEELGLINPQVIDNILSKNERDDWTVDKTSRRDYVASRYRVLALVGDDLNDFAWVGDQPTAEARVKTAEQFDAYWGTKWFLLPNANYGNWERAVQGYDDTLSAGEKVQRKLEVLRAPRKSEQAESPGL